MMHLYRVVTIIFFSAFLSQGAHAKWNEERDVTANGKDELIYYYKTNEQGQKLVLDKYVKRLIFIRPDRFHKRSIRQIKIDGVAIDVTSDPFSRHPEQTAIIFDNKDEILKKLFLAKKIELDVRYGREQEVSTFFVK